MWQIIFANLLWTIFAAGAIYALADAGYLGKNIKTELLLIGGFPLEIGSLFLGIFTFSFLFTMWFWYRQHHRKR
jgi:Zn-dependent protease with chaperone function